jgi:HPt (histidine-containing phosphotransfer) domain-containing protein
MPLMEELRRKFMPRFVAMGRERAQRARESCEGRLDLAAAEMHALAGEAALLGLGEIDVLAREGERAARQKQSQECVRILAEIDEALATAEGQMAETA